MDINEIYLQIAELADKINTMYNLLVDISSRL